MWKHKDKWEIQKDTMNPLISMVQVDNKAPGDEVTCMILVLGQSTMKQKGTTGD